MSPTNSDRVEYAAMSDVGRRRANNQDSYIVAIAHDEAAWQTRGDLFVVADGMGAHAAGELASRLAVEGVSHIYLHRREAGPVEALRQAIVTTNAEIHSRGRANVEFHNMGTTCSALVLGPAGAVIGHVGDSRVYRLRGDQLEQLTFDHSLVWEMRAMGQAIGQQNAGFGLPKNVITRSLGPNADVQVDLEGPLAVEAGDRFLMCSDGLSGKIEDAEIALIMRYLPPQESVAWLTDLANLRGGPDNITVVVTEARRAAAHGAHSPPIPHGPSPLSLLLLAAAIIAALLGMIVLAVLKMPTAGVALAVFAGIAALASLLSRRRKSAAARWAKSGKAPYSTAHLDDQPDQFASIDESLADGLEEIKDLENIETVTAAQRQLELARSHTSRLQTVDACRCYAKLTQALVRLLRNYDGHHGDLFG